MNSSKQLVNNIYSRGGACLDLHVKYMGIRKTHFPCRKPFGAIRLSHFSRIRLCRVSHSLPGAATEERLRPTSFDFITYIHTHTGQLQKLRSIRSIRYVFKASAGPLGLFIHLPSDLGSPADLSISLRDAGIPSSQQKTFNFIRLLVFERRSL